VKTLAFPRFVNRALGDEKMTRLINVCPSS